MTRTSSTYLWPTARITGSGFTTGSPGSTWGQFGSPGRNAGQFYWIDGIASDSQGNIYTGEVLTGKRVQKFVLQ